jgi:hypothetical protein
VSYVEQIAEVAGDILAGHTAEVVGDTLAAVAGDILAEVAGDILAEVAGDILAARGSLVGCATAGIPVALDS